MSFVAASGFGGKWIDPKKLNPLHEDHEQESAEARRINTQMGFGLLRQRLQQLADAVRGD